MKSLKWIAVLSLLVLVVGGSLVLAQEQTQERSSERLPWNARIFEILQNHPEVLEEIQALRQEYQQAPEAGSDEIGFFGQMRGRMMGRGRGMGHCRPAQNGQGFGHMGSRWSR